jgi:Nitric oxide synthase, oxygenase domain
VVVQQEPYRADGHGVSAATPDGAGPRIHNKQLVRYAGYRRADGTVLSDPVSADLAETMMSMGWRGGAGTAFDPLSLLIEILRQATAVVRPDSQGRVRGAVMGTEIGAHNLADVDRYDMLPEIARRMGLDTSFDDTLWKGRARRAQHCRALIVPEGQRLDNQPSHRIGALHAAPATRAAGRAPADWSGSSTPFWSRRHRSFIGTTTTSTGCRITYARHSKETVFAIPPGVGESEKEPPGHLPAAPHDVAASAAVDGEGGQATPTCWKSTSGHSPRTVPSSTSSDMSGKAKSDAA